ncbi:hypothetical protein [Actinoplanes sp. NPDC023714]|uniref:hypothetical protein n=1 Tax=Actinoplanes sp. NPDC023714 TaxID=3154322 RepID=UPI0033F259B8
MFPLPDGFTWLVPLNDGAPLDLDRRKNGDEWIHLVFRRLRATGFQMSGHAAFPGGHIYRPSGTEHRTALWVLFPTGQGPICLVLGDGDPSEVAVEPWRDAVTHAIGQIGAVTDFAWWTIIGCDPNTPDVVALRLSEPTEVAGLRLVPALELFYENVPGRFNIFQSNDRHTGLVKVTGSSMGYNSNVAHEEAARRIRLLCSLLSVAFGMPWIQRSSVNPLTRFNGHGDTEPMNVDDIHIPAISPWDRDDEVPPDTEALTQSVEIPRWIGRRWETITRDKRMVDALLNHHEGQLMMAHHPSHAALAFVTTVEALGNRKVKKLPRCRECRVVTGSGDRFRDALARVIPAQEADALGRKFYNWRSRTAHDGVLHGTEPAFGAWAFWSGISENTARDFERELYSLAAAAQRLLLSEASGEELRPT